MNPEYPNLVSGQESRPHYPVLDGLRGTAILLIVAYHNFESINIPGSRWFEFLGWISVDLFFVLSGFLITEILLKTVKKKNYLRNFYSRRILRIFPLYYLSLFIFLIILPSLNVPLDVQYYIDNQVWLWTYLQNWLYALHPQGVTDSLNHFWTLAVEEQFYLLWPLAILLLRKPNYLLIFILSLLVLAPSMRIWVWVQQYPDLDYVKLFTFTRIDGICAGCIVALLQKINRNFLKKYLLLIFGIIVLLNVSLLSIYKIYHLDFPYMATLGYPSVAILFGLLVNVGVMGNSKLVDLLFNNQFLRFFGKISYGFYIFHWPVYLLLQPVLLRWLSKYLDGSVLAFVVSLIASFAAIGISWVSFTYFEKRFLKLKEKFS